MDEEDVFLGSGSTGGRTPQPSRSYLPPTSIDDDEELDDDEEAYHMASEQAAFNQPSDFQYQHRSYDDEDEALQAALRASMEDVPDGYVMPELAPKDAVVRPARRQTPPLTIPEPEAVASAPVTPAKSTNTVDDDDSEEPAKEPSAGALTLVQANVFQMRSDGPGWLDSNEVGRCVAAAVCRGSRHAMCIPTPCIASLSVIREQATTAGRVMQNGKSGASFQPLGVTSLCVQPLSLTL